MLFTTVVISASSTSTKRQFSSSVGNRCAPFDVTHGWIWKFYPFLKLFTKNNTKRIMLILYRNWLFAYVLYLNYLTITLICGSVIRFDGSFSSILVIKSRASPLIAMSDGNVKQSFFIFSYTPGTLLAKNGTFPNSMAYNVAPSAQISAALPLYEYWVERKREKDIVSVNKSIVDLY